MTERRSRGRRRWRSRAPRRACSPTPTGHEPTRAQRPIEASVAPASTLTPPSLPRGEGTGPPSGVRSALEGSGWGRGGVAPTNGGAGRSPASIEGGWVGRAPRSARFPTPAGHEPTRAQTTDRDGRSAGERPHPRALPRGEGPDREGRTSERATQLQLWWPAALWLPRVRARGYSSGCNCSSSDRGEAGSEVMRRSVASWIAFAIAASGGTIGTSPTPRTP